MLVRVFVLAAACALAGGVARADERRTLTRDEIVGRVVCKAGTQVGFDTHHRLTFCTIARPLTVAGTTFAPGTSIRWDASGTVVGGILARPATVGGLRIAGTFELFPDGKPRAVTIDEASRVQNHDLPAHAQLAFRPDGTLESARYVEAIGTMIHGELWEDIATITYGPSGAETKTVERWSPEIRRRPYLPRKAR